MTDKIRFTKITIERHEATIIRRKGKPFSAYCTHCRTQVAALTLEEAAGRFQITVDEIGELAHTTELHFIQTTGGNLPFICGGRSGQ